MNAEAVQQIAHPVAKASAVLALGVTSWTLQDWSALFSAAAGAAGFFYSLHLLVEWWWKKYWRAVFIRNGWYRAKDNTWFPSRKSVVQRDSGSYNG